MLIVIMQFASTRSAAQDYSSYEIAKKFQREHNYVMTYRYLLIFKYSNLDLLQKPANKNTLMALEAKISEFEDFLSQAIALSTIDLTKIRGFSDHQIDSARNTRMRVIPIDPIKISN
jgi:hypothetical protein